MILSAGQDLFREGDPADGMYVVDRGAVRIWREVEGEAIELATLGPGNIFGEMALIDGSPRNACASAVEETVVIQVPKPTFDLKMAQCDPFIGDLLRLLVQNIRRVNASSEVARASARDQNPLTRLPGNRSIEQQVEQALAETDRELSLVYFDFDHFKPFNDGFGFAVGDEAIALFADALRELQSRPGCFVGHVGGDDFFACFRESGESAEQVTAWLLSRFSHDVQRFYDEATLAAGSYSAKDRDGNERAFPLLRVSAVQLDLPAGRALHTPDLVAALLAQGKKRSKASESGLYRRSAEQWG
ncbi:MAG: GGDEF domain-containing protein [Deltaproteobacteria bacterium]|nr:GGDEF domain-containing protein [Deltaproteobacteria bacterium]